jgi:chromosome segregation ATPase
MTDKGLSQLLELRRMREREALDELIRRQNAATQAENEALEASNRLSQHIATFALRERELRASLEGRSSSLLEMFDVQAKREALSLDQEALQQAVNEAWRTYHDCVEPVALARQEYRQCQQATAKIELLVQQEATRGWRRFAALLEEEPFVVG